VREVYESFGFLPLETPALEYADVLTGKYGDEADKLLYRFKDNGGRDVAMRYDLTVPLSRVVAMYQDLPRPFKRYQVGPVWRAESPQKGRFREFYQFDADTCGSSSMLADAEIVALICTVMQKLGITRFAAEINNRKLLNGLTRYAGIADEDARRVFAALDKLPKIGAVAVREELLREAITYADQTVEGRLQNVPIVQPGLTAEAVDKIMAFAAIEDENRSLLARLATLFAEIPIGLEGARELSEVLNALDAMGIDASKVRVATSIARGLDYYTGTVFETTLLDRPNFGSVFSGGRFDELIGLFTGKNVPAVGASVGVDRLFAAMEELGILPASRTVTDVLVTVFPENPDASLKLAREFREVGLNTEVFLGGGKNLKSQLRYANVQQIPVVAITFPDRMAEGTVIIRTMSDGSQTEAALDNAVAVVTEKTRQTKESGDES
jgi:histidyl-tRNA synthetase